MVVVYTNNTMVNIQKSFYRPLLLDVYYAMITCNDNKWQTLTSAVDVALVRTTKNVTLMRNSFVTVSSTSQNIFVIQDAAFAFITDWTMNGADPNTVSSAVINLNLVEGGYASL